MHSFNQYRISVGIIRRRVLKMYFDMQEIYKDILNFYLIHVFSNEQDKVTT